MSPVVALLGANGRVGSATSKHLQQAHKDGKIQLVILSRPGSKVRADLAGTGVEVKEVNLDGAEEIASLKSKLKGVQIVVSTVGLPGIMGQLTLIDALAEVEGFEYIIPAAFSRRFTERDIENTTLKPMADMIFGPAKKAEQLGLGITKVYTGVFEEYFMAMSFLGSNVNDNVVQANEKQMKNKFALTSMDFLGASLARLVTLPVGDVKNKSFTAVDLWQTGEEVVEAFTAVNGSKPAIKDYTEEDYKVEIADAEKVIKAGYMQHWTEGTLDYPEAIEVPGYQTRSLKQVAKSWKK